jgi:hypothetical protein
MVMVVSVDLAGLVVPEVQVVLEEQWCQYLQLEYLRRSRDGDRQHPMWKHGMAQP